jgi:hypothetical protein
VRSFDDLDAHDVLDHRVREHLVGQGAHRLERLLVGDVDGESKRLPMRTAEKPSTPRRPRAPATALPCGSSSSALGMTSTTMVGIRSS